MLPYCMRDIYVRLIFMTVRLFTKILIIDFFYFIIDCRLCKHSCSNQVSAIRADAHRKCIRARNCFTNGRRVWQWQTTWAGSFTRGVQGAVDVPVRTVTIFTRSARWFCNTSRDRCFSHAMSLIVISVAQAAHFIRQRRILRPGSLERTGR